MMRKEWERERRREWKERRERRGRGRRERRERNVDGKKKETRIVSQIRKPPDGSEEIV